MILIILFLVLIAVPAMGQCAADATSYTLEFPAGTQDHFAAPWEPTRQSELLALVYDEFASFDDLNANRHFGHTITGLPCTIRSATLTLHLKVTDYLASNDGIALQALDEPLDFAWSGVLSELLGQPWNNWGATATLTLDLANLPLAGGGTTSLIDELNGRGYLDIYIQDDTSVDFASLEVEHCVSNDCNANRWEDACEVAFFCTNPGVVDLAPGDCCANLTLTATYADPCNGPYTITNDYDPEQGADLTACFGLGETVVTFTSFSEFGIRYCTALIDVRDATPPTITLCPRP